MIKKLVSTTLLGVAALIGLSSQEAHALSIPGVLDLAPTIQILFPKSEAGPDGNNRFLWDEFDTSASPTAYLGSALWILDPTGKVIGNGDTMIPPGVGALSLLISFNQLHVNSDNTTTVAFQFGGSPALSSTTQISAVGTWTYDPNGKLIAFSGPTGFTGLQIGEMRFQKDFLVVTFQPASQTISLGSIGLNDGPYTVWVIDHFGNVVSAVGPQGPYTNYALGSVTLSGSASAPNQLWHWISTGGGAAIQIQLSVQEFNSSGAALSGFKYGPF